MENLSYGPSRSPISGDGLSPLPQPHLPASDGTNTRYWPDRAARADLELVGIRARCDTGGRAAAPDQSAARVGGVVSKVTSEDLYVGEVVWSWLFADVVCPADLGVEQGSRRDGLDADPTELNLASVKGSGEPRPVLVARCDDRAIRALDDERHLHGHVAAYKGLYGIGGVAGARREARSRQHSGEHVALAHSDDEIDIGMLAADTSRVEIDRPSSTKPMIHLRAAKLGRHLAESHQLLPRSVAS